MAGVAVFQALTALNAAEQNLAAAITTSDNAQGNALALDALNAAVSADPVLPTPS